MSDWFQWAIVGFIVLSILFHVWKGGAANPESTGSLNRKVSVLTNEVTTLGGRVKHVEGELKDLKRDSATTRDVAKLEEVIEARLGTVDAKLEGQRDLSQATNDSVRRIERILIEKSLGAK